MTDHLVQDQDAEASNKYGDTDLQLAFSHVLMPGLLFLHK